MTRTGRALVIGPVVVLALWVTAVAAAPGEPTPAVADPIAAGPPASAETARMLTLPALADIVAPVVLAALCGATVALFSARPRRTARARSARRRGKPAAPRGCEGVGAICGHWGPPLRARPVIRPPSPSLGPPST